MNIQINKTYTLKSLWSSYIYPLIIRSSYRLVVVLLSWILETNLKISEYWWWRFSTFATFSAKAGNKKYNSLWQSFRTGEGKLDLQDTLKSSDYSWVIFDCSQYCNSELSCCCNEKSNSYSLESYFQVDIWRLFWNLVYWENSGFF